MSGYPLTSLKASAAVLPRCGLAALGALLLVLALPGNVLAQGVPQETAQAECSADRVDLRGAWGTASFRIELADTAQKRGRGLMFRTGMEADAGMLFVYPRAGEVSFWMKNTLIPLDMIFADATGRVRKVHANAIPGDLRPISGGQDILVVLEINGGLSAEIGIEPGTQLRHPALGSAALWPC